MYNIKLRDKKEIIITKDGTKTLFSCEFNEAYHSDRDGALQESLYKHVIPALELQKSKKNLVILDICFGLGYNTLSTIYYIKKENIDTKIKIISPEFDKSLVESLIDFEYPKEFNNLREIISSLSKNQYYKDKQFEIEILIDDARKSIPKIKEKIDIVYQDAFSPKKNPLLWTKEYFADIKKLSKKDTIITTYSVASSVRMGLYENGFNIYIIRDKDVRPFTIASQSKLDLEYIDMELKKRRNPNAKSLRD
jgi:tRNA U34 5-methylaminomethyl-2-thiouridine-forming methyltransferase MnmC